MGLTRIRRVRSHDPELVILAKDMIAAADLAYGPGWRKWQEGGPARGAQALSRALSALEGAVHPERGR